MRVLIISTEFPPGPGGIGTHAWELARGLHARAWHVCVAAPLDYATADEVARFKSAVPFRLLDLRAFGVGLGASARTLFVLRRLVYQHNPDVLIASGAGAVLRAAMLSMFRSVPFVVIGHAGEFKMGGVLLRSFLRRAIRRAASVIAVSAFTAALMKTEGFVDALPTVIHNGASLPLGLTQSVIEDLRVRHAIAGRRVLLTVGNVTERKGQDLVIRALPVIKASIPEVLYIVAGIPTDATRLMDLAVSLGVGDAVLLVGRVSSVEHAALLSMSDVFLLTSRQSSTGDVEGYGIAVLEAQAAGIPVVVTDVGGLPEAVDHGHSGFVVPPEDPAAIADAVMRIMMEPGMHERLHQGALSFSVDKTWAHRVEEYDRDLRLLASQPARETLA